MNYEVKQFATALEGKSTSPPYGIGPIVAGTAGMRMANLRFRDPEFQGRDAEVKASNADDAVQQPAGSVSVSMD